MKAKDLIEKMVPSLIEKAATMAAERCWILPDGEIEDLGGLWHFEWLKKRAKAVDAKWGTDVQGMVAAGRTGEQEMRLEALRKGFFRVHLERRNGYMTIEGNAKYWAGPIKDAIFSIVHRNAAGIDVLSVHLVDDAGRMVDDGGGPRQLFQYDDAEKLEHIPLVSESVQGRRRLKLLKEDDLPLGYYWRPRRKKEKDAKAKSDAEK